MKITYFVHGTSLDNDAHISSGWRDVSLSKKGFEETKEAAKKLSPNSFDVVICSDLLRAKQSAEILFPNTTIVYDRRLRECNYGVFNGTEHYNVQYLDHINEPFSNGESLLDVEKRIRSLIDDIKNKYPNKRIALVSHRAPQLAFEVITNRCSWLEAINNDWRLVGSWQLGWDYEI